MAEKTRNFFLFVLFISIPFSIAGGDFAIVGLYLTAIYFFYKKKVKWREANILYGMAIFMAGVVLSSSFSGDTWRSFSYFRRFWRLGLVFVIFLSLKKRDYNNFLRLTLIVSGVVAIYAFVQHYTGIDFLRVTDFSLKEEYGDYDKTGYWHAVGLFSHHLTYGGVSLLLFSLFLPPALNPRFSLKERCFWGTGAALNLTAIMVSMGRSVWLGAVAAVLIILFFQFNKKLFLGLSLLFSLILGCLIFGAYQSGYKCDDNNDLSIRKRLVCFRPEHNFDRIAMWKAGVNIVKDHPWLGLGPNQSEKMESYYREVAEKYNHKFHHHPGVGVHNIYLQNAIDFGLLGLAGYLIWWLTLMAEIILAIVKEPIKASKENSFLLGSLAGLTGIMTSGFFENNFRDGEVQTTILTVMGIALFVLRQKKLNERELRDT